MLILFRSIIKEMFHGVRKKGFGKISSCLFLKHKKLIYRYSLISFIFLLNISLSNAQIAQRGTATTATSTNTSITINKPSGVISGDVMIVNIAQYDNRNITLSDANLSGWTLISGADLGGNRGRWGSVLYKIASSSEPSSYTFALDGNTSSSVGAIIAFSGIDITNPIDASGSIKVRDATNLSATSITTTISNSGIIMLGMIGNGALNFSTWSTTSPGTLTELYDFNNGGNVSVGAAWAIKATAGATGDGTATVGDSRNGSILLALRPVPTTPTLYTIPSTLDFGFVQSGTTSSVLSYTLSGINLTGFPGNIAVTAPSNFEVSLSSGSGFASSINVPYSSATLANTPIYVRFLPTSPNTNYSGSISVSGGGASTNVNVTGNSILTYCASIPTNSSGYITNVTFNTINNTSGQYTYTDYSSGISTDIASGATYNFYITITNNWNGYYRYVRTWFDWNQDGDFSDTGESFDIGNSNSTPSVTLSQSISVPAGANLGTTRMRVSVSVDNYQGPCNNAYYGEVEDYAVNIFQPGTITTSSITPTSYCQGASVSVPFSITGTFLSGNVFTAQLSNASGSFASPVSIGTLTSTTSGTINAAIPSGQAAGTGYRIRVVSSNPVVTGSDNGSDIQVLATPAQPSVISGNTEVCAGTSQGYSVTNVPGVTYNWIFPSGWNQTGGGTTNSVTVTPSGTSGTISVIPETSCTGTSRTLAVNSYSSGPASAGTISGTSPVTQGQSSVAYNVGAITRASSYVWSYSGTGATINGTTNNITIDFSGSATSGNLTVYGTNACGNGAVSANFPITVNINTCITSQPQSRTVCVNDDPTFSITTTATNRQWQVSTNGGGAWNNITAAGTNPVYSGYNTSTLTLTNVVVGNNGYQYRCVVSGGCSATSSAATLNVGLNYKYSLTASPGLIDVNGSSTLTLSGSQVGANYQLRTGTTNVGSVVPGTGGPLTFTVQPIESTNYNVLISSASFPSCDIQNLYSRTVIVNVDELIISLNPCSGQPGANFFTNSEFGTTSTNIGAWQPNQTTNPGVIAGNPLGGSYTNYTFGFDGGGEVNDGYYIIANSTNGMYNSPDATDSWLDIYDNTQKDGTGHMYIVNASIAAGNFYTETLNGLCDSTKYEFSADIINLYATNYVPNGSGYETWFPTNDVGDRYSILPNVDFLIDGNVALNTGDIINDGNWRKFGFTFWTGKSSSITLTMRNNSTGGIGNDLALDNIVMRPCGPLINLTINVSMPVCPGVPMTMTAIIVSSDYDSPVYQWQLSTDGGANWNDISGQNSSSCTINNPSNGYRYRFLTGETIESLDNPYCYVASNPVIVTTTAEITGTTDGYVCGSGTVILGATANSGSVINWYENLTGGSSLFTGPSFTTPPLSSTTTYYVDATQAGCTAGPRKPVTATVYPNIAGSVTISANTGTTICTGTNVTFTAVASNLGSSPAYQWQLNGSNISGATNSTYSTNTLANGNRITCVVTAVATPCIIGSPATSNELLITVSSSLAASVSITADPSGTICTGSQITFTATPVNGGASPSYQWQIGGVNQTGETNQTFVTSSLSDGNLITCIMTSSLGCATGSPATSNQIEVDISPLSVGGSVSGDGTIVCPFTNSTVLNLTGNTGNVLNWESSEDNISWTPISHTGTSYTVTNISTSTYFRANVQSGACAAAYSSSARLITQDNQDPAITCAGNQSVNANTSGGRYQHNDDLWNASATDNCGLSSVNFSLTGVTTGNGTTLNGVIFNAGVTNVQWTATDNSGHTATCSFTVTVNSIESSVTLISDVAECPQLLESQGFEPENSSYNEGTTEVIFTVSRLYSSTGTWGFSFNISGGVNAESVTPGPSTGNAMNGSYSGLSGTSVNLHFFITNVANTPLNVILTVTDISDSNGGSSSVDSSADVDILAMPAVGPFN